MQLFAPPRLRRVITPLVLRLAGSKLLQQTLEACSKQPECEEIYLHVQVGNDAALNFYKSFGFEVQHARRLVERP